MAHENYFLVIIILILTEIPQKLAWLWAFHYGSLN